MFSAKKSPEIEHEQELFERDQRRVATLPKDNQSKVIKTNLARWNNAGTENDQSEKNSSSDENHPEKLTSAGNIKSTNNRIGRNIPRQLVRILFWFYFYGAIFSILFLVNMEETARGMGLVLGVVVFLINIILGFPWTLILWSVAHNVKDPLLFAIGPVINALIFWWLGWQLNKEDRD
jgi:hypothetical protein